MRRVQNRVPLEECKRRALKYLRGQTRLVKASSVAGAIWPDAVFHAQGAGAAASRILKHLERARLVYWESRNGDWGWKACGSEKRAGGRA
jgi:hypothetical protein